MKIILEYAPVIDNKRTYFIEKILNEQKIHTIRKMRYAKLPFPVTAFNAYVNDVTFLKKEVTGYEELDIIHLREDSDAFQVHNYSPLLIVDGHGLTDSEAMRLAMRDGFNSWYDFQQFFDRDDTLAILHFTQERYGRETAQ